MYSSLCAKRRKRPTAPAWRDEARRAAAHGRTVYGHRPYGADACVHPRSWGWRMRQGRHRQMFGGASGNGGQERRINASVFLARLTAADGAWLDQILPTLQRGVPARTDAVRVEDIVLRHRPGRIGIADAMDATAEMLRPFSVAGATLEHRNQWFIAEEDDDDDVTDAPVARRLADLIKTIDDDLLVNARIIIDASVEDSGAAAIYWAILALSNS